MDLRKYTYQLEGTSGKVEVEYLPFVNYVLNINDVPVFEKFELTNEGSEPWHNLKASITGALLLDSIADIDSVASGETLDLSKKVEIVLNPQKLAELTEGDGTFFSIKVNIGETEVFNKEFPLLLQPYDQWIGSAIRPDLLSAFVTPNHPLISKVIAEARPILKRLTGSDSFDAYQSGDVNRVRCQIAAIYEALRAEGISYISAPASFGLLGQRVRLVDKVLEEKMGTCLDLSLLYASCLEAVGLNPLLILTKGHCFAGCWLVRDSYTQSVGDDPDFLLKGIADGISEIVVMEATCLSSTDAMSFEDSCAKGVAHLNADSEFECFIDVYQTRINHVHPIPLRLRQGDGTWQIINDGVEHEASAGKVKALDRYDLSAYDSGSAEVTKYTIWERKLLDFSLRNTLLNVRSGRRVIPLLSFAIDRLEDALQDGKGFNVRPFPLEGTPMPGERGIYESSNYASVEEHVIEEMKQKRLFSFLTKDALANSLKYVYRASRTSMEENGANNLYLVLGLLKWYETEQSKDAHFAPILLLPIEIVRAMGGGYTIRCRDEEVSLNITLCELLRQQHDVDLSVLNELPKDDHGVDVKKILAIVRDKIRNKKGWNVLDESLIGIFSFSKFVMWNDIHTNSAELHKNPIISSFVDGRLNLPPEALASEDIREFDAETKPSEYAIPIDVDSSQLEAILASGEGKSFILHGPPGTGKSQTITNIIANALYQGKRVLFVAEKMAALEVVQNRLEKIGLAPFCLELHSNKVTKQHFLHQMEEALNVVRNLTSPDYEAQAQKVFEKRQEILAYIEALHQKDEQGFSLYDCIEHYAAVADCDDEVVFSEDAISLLTPEKIAEAIELIKGMGPVLKIIGKPENHPLKKMHVCGDFAKAELQLRLHVPETAKWTARFASLSAQFKEMWGFYAPDFNCSELELTTFNALLKAPCLTEQLVLLARTPEKIASLLDAISSGEKSASERGKIAKSYSEAYLELDTLALQSQWNEANSKWFLPRYFARKKFLRQLPPSRTQIDFESFPQLLDDIEETNQSFRSYSAHNEELIALFGENAKSNNWQVMRRSLELIQEFAKVDDENLADKTIIFRPENIERIAGHIGDMDKAKLAEAIALNDKLIDCNAKIASHYSKYSEYLTGCGGNLGELTKTWSANLPMLKDWIIFRKHYTELTALAGADLWNQLNHDNPEAHTIEAMEKGFYKAKAEKLITENQTLHYFNGLIFDETIQRYRELTREFQELSKKALFCRLASNLPSLNMVAIDTSELGILKRNIKSGGRGKSIRSIIDLVPTLLPKLCPCMLMSPISVAQYISLNAPKFDIVIFDEASQMPTSEAVGAIARGKALIVVGDPKQMPPTSFFSTSAVGEDEAHIDDMESILDDCIAMSIPSKYLTWHYRSKHESLITFSNNQYYNGRLTTFPSVDNQISMVTLRHINGVYDRSRSRSNKAEAAAVVDEVIRRLLSSSDKSIGVVAFSKVQQDLIEDMLNAELAKHPELEALAYNSQEPIFVKNLENVQGDERDVILFSVGYGPDKTGKVSMNFGPLNIAGGERRLNVAVSRARYEMVVFSSLLPEQIDLRRTNALGVAGLKHFLEYAAKGSDSHTPVERMAGNHGDNVLHLLEDAVKDLGYEYDTNVGSSDFRVDIAIKDPEDSSKYILGLLLDGPSYYATKTTRDREIVQPTVLRLLGWNLLRIWTLDLFERKDMVAGRIKELITELIENKGKSKDFKEPECVEIQESPLYEESTNPSVDDPEPVANPLCSDYTPADISCSISLANAEELQMYQQQMREILSEIINVEAPVTNTLLYKRIVKAFGLSRVSANVQNAVNSVLTRMPVYSQPNGAGKVYWTTEEQANGYDKYRTNSGRDITDVPYIEIENAMLYVLSQQVALSADDLKRLTANQLGYTRKGANIEAATTMVLSLLEHQNRLKVNGYKVTQI